MSELPDKPLHADVTDEEAWAYERMIERILRDVMVGKRGDRPRTILGVEVRGHYPRAQIVIAFLQDDGAHGEAEWELWDERSKIAGYWEAPSDMASSITASWERPMVERITRPASRPSGAEGT